MAKERTQKEIDAEIKALEACKAYIPKRTAFGDDSIRKLELQIEYLQGKIDMTSAEWEDYSDDEQSSILEAEGWETGQISESPSSGWDNYKPKEKAAKK